MYVGYARALYDGAAGPSSHLDDDHLDHRAADDHLVHNDFDDHNIDDDNDNNRSTHVRRGDRR